MSDPINPFREYKVREAEPTEHRVMPSEIAAEEDEAAGIAPGSSSLFPTMSAEERLRTRRSNMLVYGIMGGIGALVLLLGLGFFFLSINSPDKLDDVMPAYVGAGPAKMPDDFVKKINDGLKTAQPAYKAEFAVNLAHDDIGKIQSFYADTMKQKGYSTLPISPVAIDLLLKPSKSFSQPKIQNFNNKTAPNTVYMTVATVLTDKTAPTANSEFGLQAKPGDVLLVLCKLTPR